MKPTYLIALVLAAGLAAACEKEAPKVPPAPKVSAPAPAAEATKPAETPAAAPAADATAAPAPAATTAPAAEPKKDEAKK